MISNFISDQIVALFHWTILLGSSVFITEWMLSCVWTGEHVWSEQEEWMLSLCVPGKSEVSRTVKDITSTSLWSAQESLKIGLFTPFLQLCTIWYNAFSFPCSEGMPEKFFLGRLKFYSMPSVRMAGEKQFLWKRSNTKFYFKEM